MARKDAQKPSPKGAPVRAATASKAAKNRQQKGTAKKRAEPVVKTKVPVRAARQEILPADIDRRVDAVEVDLNERLRRVDFQRVGMGTVILREIFAGDAEAMLKPDRATNPYLQELLRRAGKSIQLNDKDLSVLIRVTAFDALVGGHFWKRLEPAQKQAFLPLAKIADVRAGAQHAIEFDLTADGVTKWVNARLLATGGTPPASRATERTYRASLETVNDRFGTSEGLDRLEKVAQQGGEEVRTKLVDQIDETIAKLQAARAKLKSKK